MSYLVLARKYRPKNFADILGQLHISTALARAIARKQVPHALLFNGPRGVGKTTSARIFSSALNCSGREIPDNAADFSFEKLQKAVEPCGECINCEEIAASRSFAVREIDGASNNSVDNVRTLVESLHTAPPPGAKWKIFIIDEVHMLSVAAFNALLKSLEEPPLNTIFIFATTELHKVPDTVISRCQRHDFRMVRRSIIEESLERISELEGVEVEPEVFSLIAQRAEGSLRDSQSMFDRLMGCSDGRLTVQWAGEVFGIVGTDLFFKLMRETSSRNYMKIGKLIEEAFSRNINIAGFLHDFLRHWRNLLLICSAGENSQDGVPCEILGYLPQEKEELQQIAESISLYEAQRFFDIAENAVRNAFRSPEPRYVIEAALIKMAALPGLVDLKEFFSKLENSSKRRINRSTFENTQLDEQMEGPIVQTNLSSTVEDLHVKCEWKSFVQWIHQKGELRLAEFLRRIKLEKFSRGVLSLQGSHFDIDSLREMETSEKLRALLGEYSKHLSWTLNFSIVETKKNSISNKGGAKRIEKTKEIVERAREHPAVQKILEMIEGSAFEGVRRIK